MSAGDVQRIPHRTCIIDNCYGVAVCAYRGDVHKIYCSLHEPIKPSNRWNQAVKPCHFKDCSRRVSFGWKEASVASSCVLHKQEGMVQIHGAACDFEGCEASPSYALPEESHGRCCRTHKGVDMVYVNSRRCEVVNCRRAALWRENAHGRRRVCNDHRQDGVAYTQMAPMCAEKNCYEEPCFGMPPMGKPVYCARHRTEGMAEVRARTCSVHGCGKAPSYGVDGKREVCRDHRTKGMTYAILTCESPNCNKNPSFAPRGETRRRFCKRHAAPHMVNVYYKYCDVAQCPERASFESGGKLRCLQHIEPGMRPRNNICQVPGGGCTRQSSYGPEGGKPVVCTVHKQPGMVQVRTKTCKHPGCEKIPSYGFPCMSREYCKPHALEGMVYSAGSRCRFRGCRSEGTFNFPGIRGGSFCKKHREDGMVDIQPKQCQETGCKYAASFGDRREKKIRFCARHKLLGMISIQEMWPTGRATSELSNIDDISAEDKDPGDELTAYVIPANPLVFHGRNAIPGTISPAPVMDKSPITNQSPDAAAGLSAHHAVFHKKLEMPGKMMEGSHTQLWAIGADVESSSPYPAAATEIPAAGFPVTVPDISFPTFSIAPGKIAPASDVAVTVPSSIEEDIIPIPQTLGTSSSGVIRGIEDMTPSVSLIKEVLIPTSSGMAYSLLDQDEIRGGPGLQVREVDNRVEDMRNPKRARKEMSPQLSGTPQQQPAPGMSHVAVGVPTEYLVEIAPTSLTTIPSYSRPPPSPIYPAENAFKSGLAALSAREENPSKTWAWLTAQMEEATDDELSSASPDPHAVESQQPPQQSMIAQKEVPLGQVSDAALSRGLVSVTDGATNYIAGGRTISRPQAGNHQQSLANGPFHIGTGDMPPRVELAASSSFSTVTDLGLSADSVIESICGPAVSRAPESVVEDTQPSSAVEEQSFLSSLLGMMDAADPRTARVRGAMVSRLKSIARVSC